LGRAYFDEVVATAKKAMTTSNLPQNNQRVRTAAEWVRGAGVELTPADEKVALDTLRVQFEKAVRAQEEREHQIQLREQIREDQKRQREIDAAEEEARRAEQERAAVEAELDRARAEAAREIAEAMGRESAEQAARHAGTIQALQSKLAEAEARSQRAISNAQLTKKGCVYVISTIGSFGEGVFKIGMTRRADPMDRVRELGDASVPFPFDVHMMIRCDDAPALEAALHREFHHRQVNRMNPRKEFFRIDLGEIVSAVERNHGTVEYTADAEAIQFRNSQSATDADMQEIEEAFAATGGKNTNSDEE
jgi:T5orf172 domain